MIQAIIGNIKYGLEQINTRFMMSMRMHHCKCQINSNQCFS